MDELANGLLARGIRRGDAFGIVSRTRLEWTLFDFALALVGGITAPVYPNSSANEAAYLLQHAEVVGGLAEDETQLAKIESLGLAHVLITGSLDGPVNVVAPKPVPQREFAAILGRVLRRPAFMLRHNPAR